MYLNVSHFFLVFNIKPVMDLWAFHSAFTLMCCLCDVTIKWFDLFWGTFFKNWDTRSTQRKPTPTRTKKTKILILSDIAMHRHASDMALMALRIPHRASTSVISVPCQDAPEGESTESREKHLHFHKTLHTLTLLSLYRLPSLVWKDATRIADEPDEWINRRSVGENKKINCSESDASMFVDSYLASSVRSGPEKKEFCK